MKGDSVKTALNLVSEEIAAVVAQLNHEGSEAFKRSRYQEAERLSTQGKLLNKFSDHLLSLRKEWVSSVEIKTRERVKVSADIYAQPQTKGPKKNLRITLPSGHVVQRPTAAAAFVETIDRLGVDDVRGLSLTVCGLPLVGTYNHPTYGQSPLGRWLICTHSNTMAKKELLERIGKGLNKTIKVDLVPA